MQIYGIEADRSILEVVPTLAYADIAKAAFGLCSAADIETGEFDPVEFGRRCEAIAREQRTRYANAKTEGTS